MLQAKWANVQPTKGELPDSEQDRNTKQTVNYTDHTPMLWILWLFFSDVSSGQLFALKFSDWLNCFQQSCPKAEPSLDHCLWISGQSRSNHGSFELGHGFHGSHCPHHSCPFQVELGIHPRGARPPPPRKACGNPAAWASGVGGPRSLACARGALAGLTSGRPPPPRAACTNPASTSHLPWPLG